MWCYVDDEEIMSFDIAKEESIDPNIDHTSNEIDNFTVGGESNYGLWFVYGSAVIIEQFDPHDDVGGDYNTEGNETGDG